MPQPFATKLNRNPHAQFFTDSGMQRRHKLAVAFAEAMEQFAVCEGVLGSLFLVLNADQPESALDLLVEKISFSQRISLVRDCADRLSKEDRALIWAVTDRASTAAGMRNKIAHCTWGYSDILPDAVLQMPTSKSNHVMCERLKDRVGLAPSYETSEAGVMVYEQRDFDDIRLAAVNATAPLDMLSNYIMNDEASRGVFRTQILSDSETEKRYNKRLLEDVTHSLWARSANKIGSLTTKMSRLIGCLKA